MIQNVIALPQPGLSEIEHSVRKWLKSIFGNAIYNVDVFCDEDQPDYQQVECGVEAGGVIAIGLIKYGTHVGENDTERIANLSDETWWADRIADSPQTGWVIKNTRGNKPAGTPVEEEGYGLNSVQRNGDDKNLLFEALGVMNNRDFVAATNRRTGWGLVYVTAGLDSATGGYEAFYAPNVNVYMDDLIEQSIKTRKRWAGDAKWSTDMTPSLPFIAPASIFVTQ